MESQLVDWGWVVYGGALSLLGIRGLLRPSKIKYRATISPRERAYWPWISMLYGLALIVLRVPHVLGAPWSVRVITDSASGALIVTALVLVARVRWLRSRSSRAIGPSRMDRR